MGGYSSGGDPSLLAYEEIWAPWWVCYRVGVRVGRLRVLYRVSILESSGYSLRAPIGAFNSFNQYLRFAAAEAATDEFRPKAISWVIGGGIIAAFVGGTLVGNTTNLLVPQFVATYIILAVVPILFSITIQFVRMPKEANTHLLAGG